MSEAEMFDNPYDARVEIEMTATVGGGNDDNTTSETAATTRITTARTNPTHPQQPHLSTAGEIKVVEDAGRRPLQ